MYVAITEEEIDPRQLGARVLEPRDGAVVTFAGVVRDHSGSRRTVYLEYEAYRGMAEAKMAEIVGEAMARWPVGDAAIVHRVGHLEVGEVSVLIAVASPHRAEAFEACRYIIDRVKEVVPIWKKEVAADGSEWVEGPVAANAAARPED